jgi:cell migration-inducing and hyaluronan-binding protein
MLSRDGQKFTVNGATSVRSGMELKVSTERPAMTVSVSELDAGSWVIFQLEGFANADSGTAQSSLDALRKATETSYFKDNGSLWVKLVSSGDIIGTGPTQGPGGGARLQVSR